VKQNQHEIKGVDERELFGLCNRTKCTFVITSQTILPEQITQELGIWPDISHKKGSYKKEDSDAVCVHSSHLWGISSGETIHGENSISAHIWYLKNQLKSKLDILDRYKQDPRYMLAINVRLTTEVGGMSFDLDEEELTFIHRICNKLRFYLTVVKDVMARDSCLV
jgi:hypothetical protein